MGATADEPRPVDDVGPAVDQRLQDGGVLGGVVLEVGVLDDDELGASLGESSAQRGALALVIGLDKKAQSLVVEAIQAGARDFVVKPFQPSRVLEAVQRVLG